MIKRKLFICLLTSLLFFGCGNQNTVSYSSIIKLKILGAKQFSKEKWRVASQEERANMVYDLIKSHNVIGMSADELIKLLGPPTAYYDYDEFPAYFIGPKSVNSVAGAGYVLAFIVNRSTGKTDRFVIDPELR